MTQKALPFKYEEEKKDRGITAFGGLPLFLDLAHCIGLSRSVRKHICIKQANQGWTDSQVVMALILLNLAGGDCVEDLNILEADEGFCQLLRRVELWDLSRKQRREQERRWRKTKRRSIPSPSAVFRYLAEFHEEEEERKRRPGKGFIPASNSHLVGFRQINEDLLKFTQRGQGGEFATLDLDATLVETQKTEAYISYKGYKAYQPINVWWAEHSVVLHTEFRDGNVSPAHDNLRVFQEALVHLPDKVKTVRLRSDSAGYQHKLLKYCEKGEHKRFGKIEFAIGCEVNWAFKEAVLQVEQDQWHPIYKMIRGKKVKTDQEWADVGFVPNAIGHSRNSPQYRYLAIREPLKQKTLPEMEPKLFPFPTLRMKDEQYKLVAMVTNMDMEGEELIHWHRLRCGKSEEAHGIMKSDFSGGKLPSGSFGENAAWWWCMILAFNLSALMKNLVLRGHWKKKRMKAIRFNIINIPARITNHSRRLLIKIRKGHPSFALIKAARERIWELGCVPEG